MTETLYTATTEPTDPFFTGTGETAEVIDYALPVSIAGRGFLLDRSPQLPVSLRHQRRSIDLLNTQNASNSEDISLTPPEVWRRTVESWHMGAGQSRWDRTDALPFRFSDSYNVDVWDKWRFGLLPDTTEIQAIGAGKAHLTTVGPARFVAIVGTQSYWFSDIDLSPTPFTMPATVLDVTSDGSALYTLDTDGNIFRYSGPASGVLVTTVPHFNASRAFVSYVKGFIVAAGSQYLYDVTTGTPNLIYQHPLDTFTWIDACDGLAPAYLIGGVGDKWQVFAMSINDDATSFTPPVSAAPVPEGEVAYSLASYLGYILIGTSAGWRFGIPSGDGSLTFGKLVETSSPVRAFEGQDRFVWYGQSGADAGLGRADLSQFTAPMTPAYANDLRTTSEGEVTGVITYGAGANGAGRRVFIVEGVGVFAESTELAPSGWLEIGGMSFNSADLKMGMYVQANMEPLPAGSSVAVSVRYDSSSFVEVGRQETPGSSTSGNLSSRTRFLVSSVRVDLTRADNVEDGPHVNRVEYRALNIPGRASEFTIPVMIRDVLIYNDATSTRNSQDDYEHLLALWQDRQQFTYREAGQTYELHCTDFLWMPEQMTQNGSAYEGLMVLTAKEIR